MTEQITMDVTNRPPGSPGTSRSRAVLLMTVIACLASCSPTSVSAPRQTIPATVPPVPAGTELTTARTSFDTGNFGFAARYFEMALRASPNSMAACLGLAGSYDWLHRFDLADQTYANCRKIGGETFAYHNNTGFSYFLRGENGRASVSLGQAQRLRPGHPVIETNLRMVRDATSG